MIEPREPEVVVGIVVSAFGIKGEVKVKLQTDFPERFLDMEEVWLKPASGQGRMAPVEHVRFHQGVALVKFEGCDDRKCAEDLRGAQLRIEREELKELEEGRYYLHDIVGLDVYTTGGRRLGKVTEVLQGGANDVYVTPSVLIPAIKQVVLEVDLKAGKMVIEPLEGMLENEK